MSAGRELDRRHIGPDRAQIVSDRYPHQFLRRRGIGRYRGALDMRGPAAIAAAINHRAVADAIGRDHDRTGDLDFFLFERRSHL